MELAQFQAQMRLAAPTAVPTVEAIYATGHWLLEREHFENAAKVFRVMLHAAPRDERAWLALGECHERIGQPRIALELYGAGAVVASPSARCQLARARALRVLDRSDEADAALESALHLAADADDEDLLALALRERARPPS
jgi:tetratricopeptide (TPR) repeat protein